MKKLDKCFKRMTEVAPSFEKSKNKEAKPDESVFELVCLRKRERE